MNRSLLPAPLADCARPWATTRRIAVVAGIGVAIGTVGLLALSGWFITAAAIAGAAGPIVAQGFNYLIPSAAIRLLAIVRTVARYAERLLSHRAALSTLAAVRTRLFTRAAVAEATGAERLSGGEAAALLGRDVDQLEDRLIRGPAIAAALAGGLLAVAIAARAGLVAALGVGLVLAAALVATRILSARLLPARAARTSETLAALKVALTEYAASAGEIAVYGLTDRVAAELQAVAAAHDDAARRLATAEAAIGALVGAAAGIAGGLAIVGTSGGPPLAAMAALASAAAAEALGGFTRAQVRAPAVADAVRRIDRLLAVPADPPLPPAPADATLAVTLWDGDAPHRFAPDARVALVGRSGAGKTRLLETLAGLRRDAPQLLTLGGQDVRALGIYGLRAAVALVPQDPMLIAGTLLDNLRIARPGIDEPAIWEALTIACLADTVRGFPDGLDQWIGDQGRALSGGQRKRLALARGILAARPWLLLDEPTEGLDAATERELVARLGEWLARTGTGLVLVSHRPAPLALCDTRLSLDPPAPQTDG